MLLPTKNFSFNNILDRANPVIHRLITVDRDPHGILSRFFSSKQMYSMLTDFEHDRRQMILRFPYTEKQRNVLFFEIFLSLIIQFFFLSFLCFLLKLTRSRI